MPEKSRVGAKRPKLGDIVEIPIGKHFAYCQYIFWHSAPPRYGELVRVFPELYRTRPKTFDGFAKQDHRFIAFIVLGSLVRNGRMTIVGCDEIPSECRELPVFKVCNINFETGDKTWFLWNDGEYTKVGDLLPEHYDYPMLQIVGSDLFIDRIREGWTPRDEIGPWSPDDGD